MVVPYVIRQKDVDLFDSLDDLTDQISAVQLSYSGFRSKPNAVRQNRQDHSPCSTLPEESVGVEGLDQLHMSRDSFCLHSPIRVSARIRGRSSVCSSSSSSSSVCSKSFGFDNEMENSTYVPRRSYSIISRSSNNSIEDEDSLVSLGEGSIARTPTSCMTKQLSERSRNATATPLGTMTAIIAPLPIRHVTFHSPVIVHPVENATDLSELEQSLVWYSQDELGLLKWEAQQLLKFAKAKRINPKCCPELRGLHMTKKRIRRAQSTMAKKRVVEEQQRYYSNGISNEHVEESLATLYKNLSSMAVQVAIEVGNEDAAAAAIAPVTDV